MEYSEFLIKEQQILDYYAIKAEKGMLEIKVKNLEDELEKMDHKNFGLKQKIKNLEEKLYKRNDSFRGEVIDKDIRKRANR